MNPSFAVMGQSGRCTCNLSRYRLSGLLCGNIALVTYLVMGLTLTSSSVLNFIYGLLAGYKKYCAPFIAL